MFINILGHTIFLIDFYILYQYFFDFYVWYL